MGDRDGRGGGILSQGLEKEEKIEGEEILAPVTGKNRHVEAAFSQGGWGLNTKKEGRGRLIKT